MNVTLIHPGAMLPTRNVGTMKVALPLGLAYLAAAARGAGHHVSVVDAIAIEPEGARLDGDLIRLGAPEDEIVAKVAKHTDVIGVTCMFSFLWPSVRSLIHALRREFPRATILGGGEHFTA